MERVDMESIAGHCNALLGPRVAEIAAGFRHATRDGHTRQHLFAWISDAPRVNLPPGAPLPAVTVATIAAAPQLLDDAEAALREPVPRGCIWVAVERRGRRYYGPLLVIASRAEVAAMFRRHAPC